MTKNTMEYREGEDEEKVEAEEVVEETTEEVAEEATEEVTTEDATEEDESEEEEEDVEDEEDDEAKEGEEKEEEDKKDEEAKDEKPLEEASEDATKALAAELKKMEKNILRSVKKDLKEKEASKDTKEKKEKMTEKMTENYGKMNYSKMGLKVYSKKNGDSITIEKEEAKTLADWFVSIATGRYDKAEKFYDELQTKLAPLVVGTNARGGFLVPTILTNILIDIQNDLATIRPRATVIDLSGPGDQFDFNQIVGQPIVSWTGENVSKSTTSIGFNQGALTPYKLAAILPVSLELLQDSATAMLPLMISQLAKEIVKEEDKVFIVGSGTGRPTGIDTSIVRTKSAGGSLSYGAFVDTYMFLPQGYRTNPNTAWIMNSRTLAGALNLTDDNNRPLLVEGSTDRITGSPIRTILGQPILEQNDLASDRVVFGDIEQYYIGDKMQMTVEQSTQATVAGVSAFENNLTFVKVEERLDGELLDTNAFVRMTDTGIS